MAPTETMVVHLTYHSDNRGGYTITSSPAVLRFKAGQRVLIESAENRIRVIFEPPDAYQPSVFFTGDKPVVVHRSAKGMLRCGVVDDKGNLLAPETGHGVDL